MDIYDRASEREAYDREIALERQKERTAPAPTHECVVCGVDISARQQIIPWARRCLPCQLAYEESHGHI